MISDPNLFDNNLSSFPEETWGFEGDPSLLDGLDAPTPEAVERPDAPPLDPGIMHHTDPSGVSPTGLPAEPSAEPGIRFGADVCQHCYGSGYTTYSWPGDGRLEPCWYCNRTGEARCCSPQAREKIEQHIDALLDSYRDPRFGAGTCSHCGGRGYTTYPSSGSQERCYYCNGSGVSS
jgi:hypothetical protein